MMRSILLAAALLLFASCSCSENGDGDADSDVEPETVETIDQDLPQDPAAEDPAADSQEDGEIPDMLDADIVDAPADEVEPPQSPYETIRGMIHMHSPYSHDACDGAGIVDGVIDAQCLAEFRAAPCINGMDFVSITDHPSYMRDYSMQEDMLYVPAAGDRLVMDGEDPVANMVTCTDGREVMLTVGFEDQHSMPLSFRRRMPSLDLYDGITDDTPMDRILELNAAIEEAGAVKAIVHSEEDNISPATIDGGGFEAMEWYNTHANFSAVIGADTITGDVTDVFNTVRIFEDFLFGAAGPHPDLVFLAILPYIPLEGFGKWVEVQKHRPITGLLGNDAHRNVSVDPVCSGSLQPYCEVLAALFPGTLTLLISGGSIVLSDGDRIDSFQRIGRWVENRVFVTEFTFDQLSEALKAGRSYGLFSVFGDPEGFVFEGYQGSTYVAMGETVSGAVTLRVDAPARPAMLAGAPFTDAEAMTARVRVVLKRIHAGGVVNVADLDDLGESMTLTVSDPGAYYVEVWIRPYHLTTALATSSDLALAEYLWLITNPVRVDG